MQRLEVSGAVRPIYASLGFKGLKTFSVHDANCSLFDKHKQLRLFESNAISQL